MKWIFRRRPMRRAAAEIWKYDDEPFVFDRFLTPSRCLFIFSTEQQACLALFPRPMLKRGLSCIWRSKGDLPGLILVCCR